MLVAAVIWINRMFPVLFFILAYEAAYVCGKRHVGFVTHSVKRVKVKPADDAEAFINVATRVQRLVVGNFFQQRRTPSLLRLFFGHRSGFARYQTAPFWSRLKIICPLLDS